MRARNFIASGWLNVGCQLVFLMLLYLLGSRAPLAAPGAWHSLVVLLIVLVPSGVWTAFFYLRDRAEPEPSRHVIASFLFGVAAASAFALPIERHAFTLDAWMYQSIGYLALGSTLVRGALVSFVIYLGIRYGFLSLAEFDEPEDGMVYGAFIGSGFAAMKSLSQLGPQASPTLFAIAYTASTNILVYASVGSIVGYLVGRAKFGFGSLRRSSLIALLVGPFLFGAFHALNEFIFLAGSRNAFWASIALSAVFASVLLIVAARLMARLTATPATRSDLAFGMTPDGWALATVALLLGAGATVRSVATRPVTFASDRFGIAFRYPSNRLAPRLGPAVLASASPLLFPIFVAGGDQGGPYAVSVSAKLEQVGLVELNPAAYLGRTDALSFATEELSVSGRRGVRVKYSYLLEHADRISEFPEMRWAYADILPGEGTTFVLSYQASPAAFHKQEAVYKSILSSVTWPPSGSAGR